MASSPVRELQIAPRPQTAPELIRGGHDLSPREDGVLRRGREEQLKIVVLQKLTEEAILADATIYRGGVATYEATTGAAYETRDREKVNPEHAVAVNLFVEQNLPKLGDDLSALLRTGAGAIGRVLAEIDFGGIDDGGNRWKRLLGR
jgi:hypothetical protein